MTGGIRRFSVVIAAAAVLLVWLRWQGPHRGPVAGHPAREADGKRPRPAMQSGTSAPGLTTLSSASPVPAASVLPDEELSDDDTIVAPTFQDAVTIRRGRRLEASWRSGAPDPEWTQSARDSVSAQMQANNVRGELKQVDCRTTLCRVEVQFARLEETTDMYRVHPVDEREYFPVTSRDGDRVTVAVYVAPKNVQLKTITETQVR